MTVTGSNKMIGNTRDNDLPSKQEDNSNGNKAPATSSSLWSGLKNPRIVRVSRAFGGKDRHSKVTTVRGLRDRRVRLSVPTAIQLYDLQDRLGVNQPSKVVDWLLNAAHQEIDKLPPLQLPPGNLLQSHEEAPSLPPADENFESANDRGPRLDKPTIEGLTAFPQSTYCPLLASMAQYSPYYHWEATNAYSSQFSVRSSQVEAPHDTPMVLGAATPMFPSFFSTSTDFDTKGFIQTVQMANSASQSNTAKNSLHLGGPSVRPFQ